MIFNYIFVAYIILICIKFCIYISHNWNNINFQPSINKLKVRKLYVILDVFWGK